MNDEKQTNDNMAQEDGGISQVAGRHAWGSEALF